MNPIKTDLTKDGLSLLLHQFSDKPNITGLVKTYLDQVNQLDQDTFDLVQSFNIDDATGMLLDYVGYIVQEFRNGDDDETFRQRIRLKALINNSEATPNDLLEILSVATETPKVKIFEHFPVSYIMYSEGKNFTVDLCNKLRKAGPICSEQVVLIVNPSKDRWVGAERTPVINTLVDEIGGSIVDINSDQICVTVFSHADKNRRGRLSEFIAETFGFVDDVGNNIVDQDGNNIIIFLGGQKNQTESGKFAEIFRSTA